MVIGENNSKILIKDGSFDANQISDYHLSIELGKKNVSYCIIDPKKHRCLLLFSKDYDFENLFNFINVRALLEKIGAFLGANSSALL